MDHLGQLLSQPVLSLLSQRIFWFYWKQNNPRRRRLSATHVLACNSSTWILIKNLSMPLCVIFDSEPAIFPGCGLRSFPLPNLFLAFLRFFDVTSLTMHRAVIGPFGVTWYQWRFLIGWGLVWASFTTCAFVTEMTLAAVMSWSNKSTSNRLLKWSTVTAYYRPLCLNKSWEINFHETTLVL